MAAVAKSGEAHAAPGAAWTVVLVVLWYTSSMLAITTSKLTMEAAKVPLMLCSAQFLSAALISGGTLALQGLRPGLPGGEAKVLAGIAVTYTLGFFFTNLAFSLAHASFVETVKSGEPISTVVLAYALLGELEASATYASLLPVVVGVGMASSGEAGGSFAAFAATVGSNFGFSARAVFAKQLKRDHPESLPAVSDVGLFWHISVLGLLALLPLAVLSEGAALRAAFDSAGFQPARFVSVVLLNGIMYTGYNQFSFMVLSRVSTATHAVLNVCRRVCVIGVTTLFFGTPLSLLNGIGVGIAVLGMFWFTHAKTSSLQKKQA
uniref:Sugar phosphate transporter domain-containing protein n=1 Tax=Alexandrium monilatum TaxID=311494 RepID=A0A7S4UZ91_9DINO